MSVRHRWLDLLIARGVSPGTSPALTLRARQLTSRPIRERLAISIATVLCHSGRKRLTIAPEPVCIEAAAAEPRAIEEILAGECPVYARGVAMTTELLQSPDSPLFDPREPESARDSAWRSMTALQGTHLSRGQRDASNVMKEASSLGVTLRAFSPRDRSPRQMDVETDLESDVSRRLAGEGPADAPITRNQKRESGRCRVDRARVARYCSSGHDANRVQFQIVDPRGVRGGAVFSAVHAGWIVNKRP